MSEESTADSPEAQPGPSTETRRLQFGIRTILLVPLIFIVFVGLVTVIDDYAYLSSCRLFGIGWCSKFQSWLIGAEVPVWFVVDYLSQALVRFPGWMVLAGITFSLGLRRSRRAHFLAWLLALAIPLWEAVFASWVASSDPFQGDTLLFRVNGQIVSALGFVIGIGAWLVGWRIRGRHYDLAAERWPTWISRSVQIVFWTLVVAASVSGWSALAKLRP